MCLLLTRPHSQGAPPDTAVSPASPLILLQTAYPAMCRIADDKELKKHYVFAKASLEHPEVKEWVKAEGIRGIPHLSLYDGTGRAKYCYRCIRQTCWLAGVGIMLSHVLLCGMLRNRQSMLHNTASLLASMLTRRCIASAPQRHGCNCTWCSLHRKHPIHVCNIWCPAGSLGGCQ
jgi:hypothetical protein